MIHAHFAGWVVNDDAVPEDLLPKQEGSRLLGYLGKIITNRRNGNRNFSSKGMNA